MANEQMLRELLETDVDELVDLLGLTAEDLIKAFPKHVEAYLEAYAQIDLEFDTTEENTWFDDGGSIVLDDTDTINTDED